MQTEFQDATVKPENQPATEEESALKMHRSSAKEQEIKKQQPEQEGASSKKMDEVVVPSIHLQRNQTRQSNRLESEYASEPSAKQSPTRTVEEYKQQIHELKRTNIKLRNDLFELSDRLDAEIAKRLANQSKTRSLADKELENTHKMNDNLKREVRLLQKKVESASVDRVEQILNQLRSKNDEIAHLHAEIKALKKISTFQERGLVDAANDGLLTYMQENRELHLEIRKLEQRCEASQRQARKNRIQQKPTEVKTEDERVPILQKQLEALKTIDGRNKKQILVLTYEKNRLADELKEMASKLDEKNKEVAALNVKIVELRKCLRPKAKPMEQQQEQSSKLRLKTVEDEPHVRLRPRLHSKSTKLVETSSVHSKSTRKSQAFESNKVAPSNVKIVSTRLYRPSYPKMEERGTKQPSSIKFNDHLFSSRIIAVNVFLDDDNQVSWCEARYEKGTPQQLIEPPSNVKVNTFTCQEGEFVQYISGGFSNDFLDYVVFVTNTKRLVKYGVELATSTKFDFNIGEKEYPSALFGEVTKVVQGYRINRIGCFIEALPDGEDKSQANTQSFIGTEPSKPTTAVSSKHLLFESHKDKQANEQPNIRIQSGAETVEPKIAIEDTTNHGASAEIANQSKSEEPKEAEIPASDIKPNHQPEASLTEQISIDKAQQPDASPSP